MIDNTETAKTKKCKKCRTDIDKKASICPNCKAKQKPGCLMWIGGFFLILILIGALGGGGKTTTDAKTTEATSTVTTEAIADAATEAPTEPPTEAPTEPEYIIKAGMYKAGVDIEPGEYLIISESQTYLEVLKDSLGTLDSIIHNENFSGRHYATLLEGQYLSFSSGKAYPVDKAPAYEIVDGVVGDGMYKVGKDIPAGEFKVIPNGTGYFEVSKNSLGVLDSIITNTLMSGEEYITIKDGQYLKLNGATLKVAK